jgi:hypothetical protein
VDLESDNLLVAIEINGGKRVQVNINLEDGKIWIDGDCHDYVLIVRLIESIVILEVECHY